MRYRVSPTLYEVPHRPWCDAPVFLEKYSRPTEGLKGIMVRRYGPCRKCQKCLTFRTMQWRERIETELKAVERSWFVTLTFAPIHLAGVIAEANAKMKGPVGQAEIERQAYSHVQRYLKRLRKSGARFRYFAVSEYGEEKGRLHYHLLIHELNPGHVTWMLLDKKWRSFVYANLVRKAGASASYVSKYISKSISRPIASGRYGAKEDELKPPSQREFWQALAKSRTD